MSIQGQQEIIEVKGYPTTVHTKGKDKGKPKPTNPKLQAKHWFSEALLSSIFNYLDAPVTRVNSQDTSLGYAPTFVDEFLPSVERTVKACKAVMYKL